MGMVCIVWSFRSLVLASFVTQNVRVGKKKYHKEHKALLLFSLILCPLGRPVTM